MVDIVKKKKVKNEAMLGVQREAGGRVLQRVEWEAVVERVALPPRCKARP